MFKSIWENKQVAVTGGASFIGSHIVEQLVKFGSKVTVIDDLSSGTIKNIESFKDKIVFKKFNIETGIRDDLKRIISGNDVIFHLAAKHGGRGYIDSHPAEVCSNMAIDNAILNAALECDVDKVIMASSACVYPPSLQLKNSNCQLKESDTDITKLEDYLSADLEYGWAKVMGEVQLRAFHKQYGLKGASMRFVTAYGPRENETHAIIALIYKALNHQEPFEIWGDGNQDRDFTFVDDIVSACIKAAEIATIGEYNVGTGKKYTINDVVKLIFKTIGWHPKSIFYNMDKPIGVYSRALDCQKIKTEFGWEAEYSLEEGLIKTIDWYKKNGNFGKISETLLMERKPQS